jgi:hypothetical protein
MSTSGKIEWSFRPAYELVEDEEERLGRETKDYHPRTPNNGEEFPLSETPRSIPTSAPNDSAIADDEPASI